jgi:hypothetical protein
MLEAILVEIPAEDGSFRYLVVRCFYCSFGIQITWCRMVGLMNNALERICKEAVVAKSRHYPGMFLEDMRKTTRNLRIASFPAEIRTEHLLNASIELYRRTILLGAAANYGYKFMLVYFRTNYTLQVFVHEGLVRNYTSCSTFGSRMRFCLSCLQYRD